MLVGAIGSFEKVNFKEEMRKRGGRHFSMRKSLAKGIEGRDSVSVLWRKLEFGQPGEMWER